MLAMQARRQLSHVELRTAFDEDAELYDRARPRYPEELFDELASLASLPPEGKVLEVGCGTGQATVPLARRGYRVDCVELGENMARVARLNLREFPSVAVHVASFEDWAQPVEPFDLVVAATAWHWVEPEIGFRKASSVLRASGSLALIDTAHVSDERGDAFFVRVQPVYERRAPQIAGDWHGLPAPASVKPPSVDGRWFWEPAFAVFPWSATYSAKTYLDVLATYSGHRRLPRSQRERLFEGIAGVIDDEFGGAIEKRYLFTLAVARRR